MKTPNYIKAHFIEQQAIGLAALSASHPTSIAILSAELKPGNDGWVQLLPHGKFKACDGRSIDTVDGHWHIDADTAQAMLMATPHQNADLVIDYEHQTLRSAESGQPNPAAGFFSVSETEYRDGQGLFIKPRWTDKAKALLSAGEYRYLSAVFGYNKQGTPIYLHSAALTNRPGVDGLEPLVALAAKNFTAQPNKGDTAMLPEWLVALCAKLGITVDANVATLTAEQGQQALAALTALSDKADSLSSELAALSAQPPASIDLTKYVPVGTYNALMQQVAVLSADNTILTIDQAIENAQAEGKVLAAEVDYLKQVGQQQGIAALSTMLKDRPQLAALTSQQTSHTNIPEDDTRLVALSAEEKQLAAQMSLSHEELLNSKKASV
ncbi:phage protease [Agarivorans gilvus]|uniref:Protease n=1 Tax=Agarivorans gilvus TaxID=680279 RepID=A0ABQ1HXK7_9ALTE|nr:phage protease [Agarivorans gilvus]GGA95803.1 hypothetical protein GCM10007414_05790 [Agarivorans gilvus]